METTVERVRGVGPGTVALELVTPDGFDAKPGQFVRLSGDGDAGFYTLSSPRTNGTLEVTVGIDGGPDEPGFADWLADREPGDAVGIDGPFGDVHYDGEPRPVVLAGGPGIGPAVGIAERALADGGDPAVVYETAAPAHEDRLAALAAAGASIGIVGAITADAVADATASTDTAAPPDVFVFGFDAFVRRAVAALDAAGVPEEAVRVENFG
jgi:cytochrome-b5 reductase